MKSFFRSLLASIFGVVIAGVLLIFIFIGIITAKVSGGEEEVELKENTVLKISLSSAIQDRGNDNPFRNGMFNIQTEAALGLNDILENLEKAKENDNIKGIFLDLSGIGAGIGTLEEIRNALIDFKTSEKFIYAHSEYFTQKAYYLATVADKLYLTPTGGTDLRGLSAELMFFKGFMDKYGIEPQIIRHGKFKSAVEPFMLTKMSEANRKQTQAYLGTIWDHMVNKMSESRGIAREQFVKYVDEFVGFNGEEMVGTKLIDGLRYKDELYAELRSELGIDEDDKIEFVGLSKLDNVKKKNKEKGLIKEKVAVIYAQGSIVNGKSDELVIASETFASAIRKARKDKKVKAIVLRVNSGGGSALASEVIWREMELAKKEKPIIVSMGDVAASGGYYIACNADTIVANPTTITGSIGVFGLMFSGKPLMNKTLGITTDVVKTNKFSDLASFTRPLSADERALFQRSVEQTYGVFTGRVADGRGMAQTDVDKIGQGRVWSGVNAMEIGLIDVYGGLKDAIRIAAEKAGLEKYRVTELPKKLTTEEQIMKMLGGNAQLNAVASELGVNLDHVKEVKLMMENQGVQARMPFEVEIH